jgi:hypothetical protein
MVMEREREEREREREASMVPHMAITRCTAHITCLLVTPR